MQLGILFDAQKLGSGFYGYTAFRILFSVVPPAQLAGCSLFHGEVGDGRSRPYCISIESGDRSLLMRLKNAFAQSMARGLMPLADRFADESTLGEEVLALAARVTVQGDIADCQSRWLQEAWQRAVGQTPAVALEPTRPQPISTSVVAASPSSPATPKNEQRLNLRLPARMPLPLRWSTFGRTAFAWLLAFCIGGALIPWVGWAIALGSMLLSVGVLSAGAIRLRLWAESRVADEALLGDIAKALKTRTAAELCEALSAPGPQASPILRRVQSAMRSWVGGGDLSGACMMAESHVQADQAAFAADLAGVRTMAWGTVAIPACALAMVHLMAGPSASAAEAPRLVMFSLTSWTLLSWLGNLLSMAFHRAEADRHRLFAGRWVPAMTRAIPAPRTEGRVDQVLQDLTGEFERMRNTLSQKRDSELVETVSTLRTTIDQLTPVLAGFREPFVLQAVPVNGRPKAMSASA